MSILNSLIAMTSSVWRVGDGVIKEDAGVRDEREMMWCIQNQTFCNEVKITTAFR